MTNFNQIQKEISLNDVCNIAKERKENGWHFIQLLAKKTQTGIDLVYSYRKDSEMEDLLVKDVKHEDKVASITESYIAAFVFENEIHDLFGLNIEGIAIDFKGKFYNVAVDEPMNVISPEVAQRLEKQAKIDAAMAAKKAKAAAAKKEESQHANDESKPAGKTNTEGEGE